jgi:Fe-S cluster biogenesis protein NfuA
MSDMTDVSTAQDDDNAAAAAELAEQNEMEGAVLEAIDAIRPALQSDGGDIIFHGIDADGVVNVELVGACGSCPVSTMTLKAGVERIIMDRVPGITEVREVNADPLAF